jgi:hypothetical protein
LVEAQISRRNCGRDLETVVHQIQLPPGFAVDDLPEPMQVKCSCKVEAAGSTLRYSTDPEKPQGYV